MACLGNSVSIVHLSSITRLGNILRKNRSRTDLLSFYVLQSFRPFVSTDFIVKLNSVCSWHGKKNSTELETRKITYSLVERFFLRFRVHENFYVRTFRDFCSNKFPKMIVVNVISINFIILSKVARLTGWKLYRSFLYQFVCSFFVDYFFALLFNLTAFVSIN